MSLSRSSAGVALAVAGVVALLLSGCAGAAPAPSPSPSADAADPIFASDEEALAAAVEAYEAFESVSHSIATDGGEDPDRIRPTVTDTYAVGLLEEFDQYRALGLHVVGSSSLDSFELAEFSSTADSAFVTIYVCRDVTGVQVIDEAGADVTPADRSDRTPLIADLIAETGGELVVGGVELWPGDDFC
ncbi:MAG: hypothetical protein ACRDT9_12675 [Agromyces sp.]